MKTTVTVTGMKKLKKYMEKATAKQTKRIQQETYASALDIQNTAKKNLKEMKTWDLGNLANSILAEPTKGGIEAEIGPTAPYGPYIEHGTKKHFPPLEALEGWARRHGFDSAWPICKIISERGTPERPYLQPAFLAEIGKFFSRLVEVFTK